MYGTQQYPSPYNAAGQFDPQGFLGSLLAGAAGGAIGKHFGGSAGQQFGSWAGRIGGGFLPFEAGPSAEAPNELEMQGFWNVLRKVAQGAQTGYQVGRQLGIFEAGPQAVGAQAGPSELEMQAFWSVLRKIAQGAQTGINVGRQLGIFEAGPTAGAQAGFGPAQAGPSELELQGFWSVLRRIAQGAQTGIQTGLNVGRQLGVFEAGPQAVGAQGGPSELEMQAFWSVLRKIAQGAQTGIQTGLNIGKQLGVFEAAPPGTGQQGVGAPGGPSDLEMQGFWSVLRKIAQGAQTGIQTGLNVGKQLGIFEAGAPGSGGAGAASQEQLVALLQQALPALQAIAQQSQAPRYMH